MIRSLAAHSRKSVPASSSKRIQHPCTPNLIRVKHVARISGTCVRNNSANPSSTHGQQTKFTLDIMPDIATDPDLSGPEIPAHFQPSAHTRGTSSIRHDADSEAPMRPIFVVAGDSSQQSAGGLTYEEQQLQSAAALDHSAPPPVQASSPRTGVWADFLEDIGIPANSTFVNPFKKQSNDTNSSGHPPSRDQPLNDEEKQGLRALLLIFGGLWLAGSLGKPKSKSTLVHT